MQFQNHEMILKPRRGYDIPKKNTKYFSKEYHCYGGNMSTIVVVQQMGVIVILVAIGFYLYKKKVVDNIVSRRLSVIVMDICNPALILASTLSLAYVLRSLLRRVFIS